MTAAADLLAIGWEPELRGILIVIIAVGRAVRQHLPDPRHQPRRPPRLPRRPHRPRRLDVADGHHLDDLRHRPQGPRAVVGGRSPVAPCCRTPTRCTRPASSTRRLDVPGGCRAERDGRRSSPPSSRTRAGSPLGEAEPGFGQAAAAAATFLEETGAFAAGEFQAVNVFDTGGERYPKISDVARLPRLLPQAALRRRRGRPARADPHRARPGAGRRRDRHDPPAPVRVHGPRPRRPPPAGVRADDRRRPHLPDPVLAPAPPRPRPDRPTAASCPSLPVD